MSSAAPGYSSWAWSQQDWRVVVPLRTGQVDYSERCGGASNRTPSGHVRLCLPVAVVSELIETPEGMAILHAQAMSKQRAPVGTRVPWHPRITALWRAVEDRTPEDRRPMYDNPTTPGTRLEWDDLAGWLASMDEIVRRPSAAKTYRDREAHLALLTPEVLATAQSVYELDVADRYVRQNLPPKGKRAGHPMTMLVDAVDRKRTAFMFPGGSASARVTLSQGGGSAAVPFVSPMKPLSRYVHNLAEPLAAKHLLPGERRLPKPYRLPYALERHPYLVVPLYVQAALPTLPPAPSGKKWMINPTDDYADGIYLVSARSRRIEASTPRVRFIWFHSPRPWSWSHSGAAEPGNTSAHDAAQRLLQNLGYIESAPPPEPAHPEFDLRRIGPGHYVHRDSETGHEWSIFHHSGEFAGEDNWVYMRTDDGAAGSRDSQAQDSYRTKAQAIAALFDLLANRFRLRRAAAVGTIKSAKINFSVVAEWHYTTVRVAALAPPAWELQPYPAKIAWVAERWQQIKAKLPPYELPPRASDQGSNGGDASDHPEFGLGWYDPAKMETLDTEGLVLEAKGGFGDGELEIRLDWSHR